MAQNKFDNIISYLESCGMSQDEIDAALDLMDTPSQKEPDVVDSPEALVRAQIMNEPDWRKRAALVAGIISKQYE